jgi:hypothetical protein
MPSVAQRAGGGHEVPVTRTGPSQIRSPPVLAEARAALPRAESLLRSNDLQWIMEIPVKKLVWVIVWEASGLFKIGAVFANVFVGILNHVLK